MPSVDFVLPHWLYWVGLVVFPLVAMYLARKTKKTSSAQGYSIGTAYFVWLVGGFLGLHRLYLRSAWGLVFWPLFALILYASSIERSARVEYSDAIANLELVDSSIERKEKSISKSDQKIEATRERLESLEEGSILAKRYADRILKEEEKISRNKAEITKIKSEIAGLNVVAKAAEAKRAAWDSYALYAGYLIGLLLLIDLLLIPSLLKKAAAKLASEGAPEIVREPVEEDSRFVGQGVPGILDRISLYSGEFVAFWSIIAVFVYYYEVVVRYVFNSPTNWAHESMFLMFGMQYLVAGAYAMLTGSHVRVDIFYAKFSTRMKAAVDLLTSIFFFIFAGTLLVTSYIFSVDAIGQQEVSFTEWAIQYWPVKCVMIVGSLLLIIQGISLVLKDVKTLIDPSSTEREAA
ncbi:TRAP transporter small permease subunit [Sneathiella glossodoripedis]|uniref:TRAP transporter small permease subunit n=1 Tax=Sneathiella glossodoripedis TaxID=418853 RepID=UPI00046FFB58|nr:TRAP transporter small permease subunit [Sneathiella glossodoripedis]